MSTPELLNAQLDAFRAAGRNLQVYPLVTRKDLAQFGVDYQLELVDELESAIENSIGQDNKLVFTGHRGCGKSTLLAELGFRLTETGRYFVVNFSISDTIERAAVDHVNILFSMALQLLEAAERRQVKLKPGIKKSLYQWLGKHTQTESQAVEAEIETSGEASVEGGIPGLLKFLAAVKSKLKVNSVIRKEITVEFSQQISELIAKINEIQGYVENATKQQVLVIIDDLDKLDLAVTETIFTKNIKPLLDPNCRIIYTIPIAILRDVSIKSGLVAMIKQIHIMRVAKFFPKADIRKKDRIPDARSVEIFEMVIDRRLPSELIDSAVKREIVIKSGGVLRELIRLLDRCCDKCLLQIRGQLRRSKFESMPIVNQAVLDQVLIDFQIEFAEPLGKVDFEALKQIYMDSKPTDTENQRFLDLLHGLYILEYRNAVLWYDLNPIVIDLLIAEGVI
jgi:nucleoside-triphosphatase THEP1